MRLIAILLLPLAASAANVISTPRPPAACVLLPAPLILTQPGLAGVPALAPLPALPALALPAPLPAPVVSVPARPDAGALLEDGGRRERGTYKDELLRRTRWLYRRFFPGFDPGFEVELSFSGRTNTEGTKGSHEVDPRKKGVLHEITLIEPAAPDWSDEHERSRTPFSRNAAKNPELFNHGIQRWVARTVTLFHEYSHGVFHELTPPISRGFSMPESDMIRVDLAMVLDEGFAVMMETLLIDRMVENAKELGLTPEDVSDLKVRKTQRLLDMRHRRDHYTAGTYYFMHRLYKQEGAEGLLRFLKDLDMERLYTLYTYDPAYRLIQDSPTLFKAYLTKTGDARLREGVDALAAYLAGSPAAPEEEAGLRDTLGLVSVSALARIARLYISRSSAQSDPSLYRGFVERVARLDARAAQNLPDP
ncbi:MAG TPA: hypothetical protein DCM05_03300 [Elusimicrobia bacterium]|nr:hypothetical protein [Elusimicrobiota bacterium]